MTICGQQYFLEGSVFLDACMQVDPAFVIQLSITLASMLHMRLTAPRDGAHGVRGAHGMAYINLTSPPPKRVPILAP